MVHEGLERELNRGTRFKFKGGSRAGDIVIIKSLPATSWFQWRIRELDRAFQLTGRERRGQRHISKFSRSDRLGGTLERDINTFWNTFYTLCRLIQINRSILISLWDSVLHASALLHLYLFHTTKDIDPNICVCMWIAVHECKSLNN